MKHTFFIGLALTGFFLLSCSQEKKDAETQTPVVRIDTVAAMGQYAALQYPGRVVPAREVNASFKVAGTLRKVFVEEGQQVRAGQVLAEIDPVDYQVQLSATEAEYAQIKADAERVIGLYEEGGTTASNYDKARYGLQQIEAKLQNHRNQLAYTRIYAPFSGRIQTKWFEGGETVSAGMPIVSVLSDGHLEVEVNLPATSYMHRQEFSSYSCMLDVMPDTPLALQPISILPRANANQLYTMRLRLGEGLERVAPGMSAWVTIHTTDSLSGQMSVPSTALVEEGGHSYLYRYTPESGMVRRVSVSVERLHTDGTAVVSGALHPGELVVSSGAHHLKDGLKVDLLAPISKTNVGGLL